MKETLTERLKKETRKEHAFTEKAMNAKAMFSKNYDLKSYTNHLFHLYKAHAVAFEIIFRYKYLLPSQSIIPKDRRLDLDVDLKHLNIDVSSLNFEIIDSKSFCDLPKLIGLLYVVKGSELGGHIIGQQIEKHRTRWQMPAANFYKLQDNKLLMKNWSEWCARVNKISYSDQFVSKAVESAKSAFDLFISPQKYAAFKILEEA
jgi:heme oxygenase